jgi:hypothetical protein
MSTNGKAVHGGAGNGGDGLIEHYWNFCPPCGGGGGVYSGNAATGGTGGSGGAVQMVHFVNN